MKEIFETARGMLANEGVRSVLEAAAILLAGLLAARVANRRLRTGVVEGQRRLLLRRFVTATIVVISLTWALSIAGVDIGVLLGTAGILTVALGFAAQTSVSNLISGLFLMAERPFQVGNVIEVGGAKGVVITIGLMSVKLRTFDNLLVRIPNESMLKANLTNKSHFPIRRYDLQIGVAYKEDLSVVRRVLLDAADKNTLCLRDPKPMAVFQQFGESSIDLQLSVWAKQESYLDLRNSIADDVKVALDHASIEIAFPHRTLYSGSATLPLSVTAPSPVREGSSH